MKDLLPWIPLARSGFGKAETIAGEGMRTIVGILLRTVHPASWFVLVQKYTDVYKQ